MRRYWFGLTCEVGPMIKQRKVRVMVAGQLVWSATRPKRQRGIG